MKTTIRPFVPKMLAALAFVGAVTLLSNSAFAQALNSPAGACWSFNGNGYQGHLCIPQVDINGNLVSASVYGNPIRGFWDRVAQRITFIRIIDLNNPTTYQVFSGYVHPTVTGSSTSYTMDGTFVAFQGTGGTASRHEFGWTARR